MKRLLPICIIPLAAMACSSASHQANLPSPGAPEQEASDTAIIHSFNDTAINNGIIAQHTLYPYHFVQGSAELNELGTDELTVLCDHYRAHGGPLNVHRGDAAEALYRQRVEYVARFLVSNGVASDKTVITDGLPGGPGIASSSVILMLKTKDEPKVDYQTPGKVSVPAIKGAQ